MEAVEPLRGQDVSAIELIDRALLDLARLTPYRAVAEAFPGVTQAVLAVEVEGDDAGQVGDAAARLAELGRRELGALQAEALVDPAAQRRLWAMRKAAVPIMYRMPGDAKPVPFIEDMAVPPRALPDYVRGLRNCSRATASTASSTPTPATAACTSGRSSTSRTRPTWRRWRAWPPTPVAWCCRWAGP